jgi:hypothetical protein
LLDEHFRERRDQSGRIWRLLMFELWHRNYLEQIPKPEVSVGSYRVSTVTGNHG